jgi:acetoin utilization transport system ATP-binding protein
LQGLADEPTGSLDSENENQLLSMIRLLNQERGTTFVLITHDEQVASIAHRTVTLKDGRLQKTYAKGGAIAYEVH